MKLKVFLLLIVGGIFASALVIVIIFIIINTCIKKRASGYDTTPANHTKSSYEMSSSFKHDYQEDVKPPLPPRSQFDTESLTNSYEEMPENPMVAEETSSLQKPVSSSPPDTRINFQDNISAADSYDDVDEIQNVQHGREDVASLPDYLEVEAAEVQKASDNGSESYDDVDELHADNEDYDDVG